ncbi:MAG: FeoB small GTPase domain-containing protein, partial [bacterium]
MSAAIELPLRPVRVALVGTPNAGKTTLFNALTGSTARVGNYPGVTVERREGALRGAASEVRVLDLPGTYSLVGETPDEQIVEQALFGQLAGEPELDGIVCVVDATTLRRGLGLVREVLKRGRPTVLVLTMIDEVRARGGKIEPTKLSQILGIPVLGVVGHRGVGMAPLHRLLPDPSRWSPAAVLPVADTVEQRFAWVDEVCRAIGANDLEPDTKTDRIDRVLLHPVFGLAVFAAVMILLFQSIFTWAVPAMDAIDAGFGALARVSREVLPAGWLTDLWADGVLAGVGSVLIFLPQIVLLFTFIHVLQDVGYMARAAFVVDRVMGWVGLQGR